MSDREDPKPLTWLLQANMRDQGLRQKIEAALDSLGEEHHAVTVVPFSRELPELPFAAEDRRNRLHGASVTCVDVASNGDAFGIVEANCFNAARLYAADAATVLAAVAAHERAYVRSAA